MMDCDESADDRGQLTRLRVASVIEGTTLLLLILGAVPARHLFGYSSATSVMGPIHGMAFLFYGWMLIQTVAGGGWSRQDSLRMMIAAFVPFGAFYNERLLARRQAALSAAD